MRHARPRLGECERHLEPDPAPRPGHERDAVRERELVRKERGRRRCREGVRWLSRGQAARRGAGVRAEGEASAAFATPTGP